MRSCPRKCPVIWTDVKIRRARQKGVDQPRGWLFALPERARARTPGKAIPQGAALRRDLLFQGGSQAEILLPALGQARLVRRLVFFQGLSEVSSRLVEGPEIVQGLPVPRVDL